MGARLTNRERGEFIHISEASNPHDFILYASPSSKITRLHE